MTKSLSFFALLLCGLALVTWSGYYLFNRTARGWFERDVGLRAAVAVRGTKPALMTQLVQNNRQALVSTLNEMTRDERIMAAVLCDRKGHVIAETLEVPRRYSCDWLHLHASPKRISERPWTHVVSSDDGNLHISAMLLADADSVDAVIGVIHDLSFVTRREGLMQRLFLITFALLVIAASLMTLFIQRVAWRGWSRALREALIGVKDKREVSRPEFAPLLRDVRDLVETLSSEPGLESSGAWTPSRLKQTLNRYLFGEKIVIVANREPYIHEKDKEGNIEVRHPASGLVTALEPVMRACSGVWVAHGSGSADRETVDKQGHVRVPPGEESYVIRRVWLSEEEERGYYYGFSNEGLWPLCHVAHTRPLFRVEDWQYYQSVNQRFADAVCEEVDTEDPIVLVQDYHFALAPKMIRARLPRATILTFWHIPWPNAERFGICPWHKEILKGLLGSSILGFHTRQHCNNFIESVDSYIESRIDREDSAVVLHGSRTLVRPYPISVDWPNQWALAAPSVEACRAQVRKELGIPDNMLLGVGVDRLDYTKGIEERLLAVERLLERFPEFVGRFVFVQLAAPSRAEIERYKQLNEAVEACAKRVNARFGNAGYAPIILLRAHHEPPKVFRYYRAADVCYVSSLHDGMNLVAKEFVAARDDEQGVLVLSHFTGAARELTEALIVNPYDMEEASSALAAALTMSSLEQRDRMRAMRALVSEFNVYRWAGKMLTDAAKTRRRERLTGRIAEHSSGYTL